MSVKSVRRVLYIILYRDGWGRRRSIRASGPNDWKRTITNYRTYILYIYHIYMLTMNDGGDEDTTVYIVLYIIRVYVCVCVCVWWEEEGQGKFKNLYRRRRPTSKAVHLTRSVGLAHVQPKRPRRLHTHTHTSARARAADPRSLHERCLDAARLLDRVYTYLQHIII